MYWELFLETGVYVLNRREYLAVLSDQIRYKRAVPFVVEEIEGHIEEQKSDFIAGGMTDQEAEEAAVMEMGDPVETGVEMDRIHRPRMNWKLAAGIAVVSLLGFFLLLFLDASGTGGGERFLLSPLKQLCYIAAGLFLMFAVCYVDYTQIARRAKAFTLIMTVLLLAGTVFGGVMVNGSLSYISVGVGFVNIPMFALLQVPLYGAVLYTYRGQGYRGLVKGILWTIPAYVSICVAGSMNLLRFILIYAIVLTAAVYRDYFQVSKLRAIAGIWVLALGSGALVVANVLEEQAVFATPATGSIETSYQSYMIGKLLSGCQLIGKGQALTEPLSEIPGKMDYALAYTAAYAGILPAVLVTAVVILVIIKALLSVTGQKNKQGALMGIGCVAVTLVQIGEYVLVNAGFSIPGNVYCPFITYGGAGAVVTYALLGLMLSICRNQNIVREQKPEKLIRKEKIRARV